MDGRLKFIGWGTENTGLDEEERNLLFRFLADRLGIEPRLVAAPRLADIGLRPSRVTAPDPIAHLFTIDPYERLLHTYGKSYPETVRAFERDFANAPDLVASPTSEADVSAVIEWASGANVAIIRESWWIETILQNHQPPKRRLKPTRMTWVASSKSIGMNYVVQYSSPSPPMPPP